MPRTTEKPTVTVGNGQPIALMSAAYCDEMRMRRPQCPQCGRQWYRIPAGQRAECACGYFGLQECTGDYYVEPCFIEFAWQVYTPSSPRATCGSPVQLSSTPSSTFAMHIEHCTKRRPRRLRPRRATTQSNAWSITRTASRGRSQTGSASTCSAVKMPYSTFAHATP